MIILISLILFALVLFGLYKLLRFSLTHWEALAVASAVLTLLVVAQRRYRNREVPFH